LVQTYTAEQLYSGDLAAISASMNQTLTPLFADSNVVLEYFELKRPRFQENYEQAIEAKQIALERIETAANEARVAEQEAIRQANLAQGEANAERIRAEGEAQAIALRGQATRQNPEIVSLNYIEALRSINWAILDGESIQPFLTLDPPGAAATPAP
jgi:regulator of protease activity HflC (stomatin/prohibitin superfamily)